jgi:hypothetical protein
MRYPQRERPRQQNKHLQRRERKEPDYTLSHLTSPQTVSLECPKPKGESMHVITQLVFRSSCLVRRSLPLPCVALHSPRTHPNHHSPPHLCVAHWWHKNSSCWHWCTKINLANSLCLNSLSSDQDAHIALPQKCTSSKYMKPLYLEWNAYLLAHSEWNITVLNHMPNLSLHCEHK